MDLGLAKLGYPPGYGGPLGRKSLKVDLHRFVYIRWD